MTGFAGRVILEGDREEAESLLPKAIKLAETLNAWKKTQNIPAVTKAFDLGNDSYCVVADMQHMRAIQVVTPAYSRKSYTEDPQYLKVIEALGVNDVVSGVVTGPTLVDEQVDPTAIGLPAIAGGGKVTKQLLRVFRSSTYANTRYTDVQRRYRLAIEEDPVFAPLSPSPSIIYSEHAHTMPSNYSGAMRKVVQLILGMGRTIRPTWEEKWIKENKKSYLSLDLTDVASNTPRNPRSAFGFYNEPTTSKTVLQYDYRFAKTHGISFDTKGVAWVIEISQRGVYAMRLYLDPVSQTKEGKKRYTDASPELEEFIKEFGGFPVGTGFPRSTEFDKWKKAGEVVELIDTAGMSEFYSKSIFSSAIGWSFNKKGTEAHNCAVGYKDNLSTGNHYRISIKLDEEKFPSLGAKQAQLLGILPLTKFWQANKVRRMTESQAAAIISIYEASGRDAAMESFLDVTVTPTLKGTATLKLERTGYLYHHSRQRAQPQIKFPEPLMDGLVSFDFSPLATGAGVSRCEAPMFVCHIDDALDVVMYSYDGRPRNTPQTEYTRQSCQFTGSWRSTVYGGEPFMAGNFYSNRWDFRQEIVPDDATTTYKGRLIGVQAFAQAMALFSRCIVVQAYSIFNITSEGTSNRGRNKRLSVAIPFNNRDCYYMATNTSISGVTKSVGSSVERAIGPEVQIWSLYNSIFHWFGCPQGTGDRCIAKFDTSYSIESCVSNRIPGFYYAVCPEIWSADRTITVAGSWGDGVLGAAYYPPVREPSAYNEITLSDEPVQACEIRMVADAGYGDIVTKSERVSGSDPAGAGGKVDFYSLSMSDWWFRFSPDPESGAMPWMGVSQSCLGNPVINYHTDMDGYVVANKGAPQDMYADVRSCYTGVIR